MTTAECSECDLLFQRYESATFDLAKARNALDVAKYLRDGETTQRLTMEANEMADRQRAARSALARHRDRHQQLQAAGVF